MAHFLSPNVQLNDTLVRLQKALDAKRNIPGNEHAALWLEGRVSRLITLMLELDCSGPDQNEEIDRLIERFEHAGQDFLLSVSPDALPTYISVPVAAGFAKVHDSQIKLAVAGGLIKTHKVGKEYYALEKQSFLDWLKARKDR